MSRAHRFDAGVSMAPFMSVNLTRMRRDAILFRRGKKKAELILSMLRKVRESSLQIKKGSLRPLGGLVAGPGFEHSPLTSNKFHKLLTTRKDYSVKSRKAG